MSAAFPVEVLAPQHDRKSFFCGVDPLDQYFRERVTQDIRRRTTVCYVTVDAVAGRVAGYYTLAASSIPLGDVPHDQIRRLPRYPLVPVARLGRLAVDTSYRGRQIGALLLWDAAARAARSGMGVFALVVDAKDERAEGFYRHHGFVRFGGTARLLFLPLAGIGLSEVKA